MVGVAFDGFPIYGPYFYTSPWNNGSGISLATSSYRIKAEEVAGRPTYGTTQLNPPAGALMQDWEYAEGLGVLDYHNGRFCVTPEYPNGTYAYFLSTELDSESNLKAIFPYLMGFTCRESIDQPPNNGAQAPPPPPSGEESTSCYYSDWCTTSKRNCCCWKHSHIRCYCCYITRRWSQVLSVV